MAAAGRRGIGLRFDCLKSSISAQESAIQHILRGKEAAGVRVARFFQRSLRRASIVFAVALFDNSGF